MSVFLEILAVHQFKVGKQWATLGPWTVDSLLLLL